MAKVVVVGAGILGVLQARGALARGHEVVHLERELIARGASVRNFGLVWVSGRKAGDELLFALRARALWDEVAEEIPAVGFRANGSLTILRDDSHVAVANGVLARSDAETRRFELLDARAARAVNPSLRGDFVAALHCPLDGAVEPRSAAEAIRLANKQHPAYDWRPNRQVVELRDNGVRDHLGGWHEADAVLVCPGAARGIAGWDPDAAPLRRVRLQMMETEPFAERVTTSLADWDSLRYYPAFDVPARAALPPVPPLVEARHIQLLLQQRLGGGLTIGDTHDYDEPFDVAVDDEPYAHLLTRVKEILGGPVPPVRRRWAGVYSQATDDRLFLLDQPAAGVHVVTGAGGRGMTLSPAIAEVALDAAQL